MEKEIQNFIKNFTLEKPSSLFDEREKTKTSLKIVGGKEIPIYQNEFWTSKQRKSSSIHEISYRACFKAQLPNFFIKLLTQEGDFVYDPFMGRGTTVIEGALQGRKVFGNDVNPLSKILTEPRLKIPSFFEVEERLKSLKLKKFFDPKIDLSMFYHRETEEEIYGLRNYLSKKKEKGEEDYIDKWIRMVATNRLTGHSKGFFSVYTLPPNQAVTPESQKKINKNKQQKPEYRDVKAIIIKKTKSLLSKLTLEEREKINSIGEEAKILVKDARETFEIPNNRVKLTVTSPPFLDIVQYTQDNWLRCWFNKINAETIEKKITMVKDVEEWSEIMKEVFCELYRITQPNGWVAFEVGEVRKGKINLEDYVIPIGISVGFECKCVVINEQNFTKTSNIWGIKNNSFGTNTNRIVLFKKSKG